MARHVSSETGESKGKGRRASVAKVGRTLSAHRAGQQESLSTGPPNGWSEDHAEDQDPLHQQIAERAYILYERSGFQHGKDLEHWLEAEQQVKGVRGEAA